MDENPQEQCNQSVQAEKEPEDRHFKKGAAPPEQESAGFGKPPINM
jgi:hypothetical protein